MSPIVTKWRQPLSTEEAGIPEEIGRGWSTGTWGKVSLELMVYLGCAAFSRRVVVCRRETQRLEEQV